jgi:hypothetical protein
MLVLKEGNRNTKRLANTSLARTILEYGAACWVPYREGQINALDRVQTRVAQFTNLTKDSDWETLAQLRMVARLCALFKAVSGDRAWKAIRESLRRPYYLSRVDRVRGDRGSTVVKVLCYKSEGRWFDPRWCQFFIDKSFWSHYGSGVDSASNINEYQENFLGVNSAGAYGWQPYHYPVPLWRNLGTLTSWNPLGHLQACNGTALPFLLIVFGKLGTGGIERISGSIPL